MDRKALYALSYGVYLVSTMDGTRPTGCIANSAMQITSEPATVAVSINHQNHTNACIQASGKFSLAILPETCDPALIGQFGFQSGREVNKYDDVPFIFRTGVPVPDACMAWMTCTVIDKLETATHTVFLGHVLDAERAPGFARPMTYDYYRNVVKGKSPKNAPTYQPEAPIAPAAAPVWRCSVCGYIYDGETPFADLPADYTCPICKQPKSVFKQM